MTNQDYYRLLNVPPTADVKAIKAAYRRLALQYHPDTQADAASEEKMKQVNEAYAVLSDPQKRAAYDRKRTSVVLGMVLLNLFKRVVRKIVR